MMLKRVLHRYKTRIVLAAFSVVMASCTKNTIYNEYRHTPITGWEKNDTLFFDIPPVLEEGTYSEDIGLRINGAFPFTGLCLIVEQRMKKAQLIKTDTIMCKLIDKDGSVKGHGISSFQYQFHVSNMELKKGESLRFCIRHNMKREILPGISDIGLSIRRLNN